MTHCLLILFYLMSRWCLTCASRQIICIANQIYLGFRTAAVRGPTIYKVALLLEKYVIIFKQKKLKPSDRIGLVFSVLSSSRPFEPCFPNMAFLSWPKAFLFEWAAYKALRWFFSGPLSTLYLFLDRRLHTALFVSSMAATASHHMGNEASCSSGRR